MPGSDLRFEIFVRERLENAVKVPLMTNDSKTFETLVRFTMPRSKAKAAQPRKSKRPHNKSGILVGDKFIAKPVYSPDEVVDILGIGRTTVTDRMDDGSLPFEILPSKKKTVARKPRTDGKQMRPQQTRVIPFESLMQYAPFLRKQILKLPAAKKRS